MLYFTLEGQMEFPDTLTKKEMKEIYEEYEDFLDEDPSYMDFVYGGFMMDVFFDEGCTNLIRALKLIKRFNGTLNDIRCDDILPEERWRMRPCYEELIKISDEYPDVIIGFMQEVVKEQFPSVEWREEQ